MEQIKERPILFSGEMARAILEGRKTVTRRVLKLKVKPQDYFEAKAIYPDGGGNWIAWETDEPGLAEFTKKAYPNGEGFPCPYGKPGDRLWVRETWRPCKVPQHGDSQCVEYRATDYCKAGHLTTLNRTGWKPSIFMPRWASRLTLEITEVRVERLARISEADCLAEGINLEEADRTYASAVAAFAGLWDSINGRGNFYNNPWVWVISFRKVEVD